MSTEFQDAHLTEVKPLMEKEEVITLKLFRACLSYFRVTVGAAHVFLVLRNFFFFFSYGKADKRN